jgi:hypothetical protein
METHGGRHVPESDLQETRKDNLTKTVQEISQSRSVPTWQIETQQEMLRPLGMWEVRSKRIRKMTEQYLTWDKREASDLHGIGKYGSDSYQIFFHDHIPPNVQGQGTEEIH